MSFVALTLSQISTPGGLIEAKPGRKMSVGDLIICFVLRGLPRWVLLRASTETNAFQTMRRSSSISILKSKGDCGDKTSINKLFD